MNKFADKRGKSLQQALSKQDTFRFCSLQLYIFFVILSYTRIKAFMM